MFMKILLKDISTKKCSSKLLREGSYWAIFGMYAFMVSAKILELTVYKPMALTFITMN